VGEAASKAARYEDELPPYCRGRLLSLRAFGDDNLLKTAITAQDAEADAALRRMVSDPSS
jgi:hypothetical protein